MFLATPQQNSFILYLFHYTILLTRSSSYVDLIKDLANIQGNVSLNTNYSEHNLYHTY